MCCLAGVIASKYECRPRFRPQTLDRQHAILKSNYTHLHLILKSHILAQILDLPQPIPWNHTIPLNHTSDIH